ncbi:UNVERIFIED_CONTAM: hypothetical protein Slati_0268900 [Sesamum latifolium]|uniref:Uncharacterized protein n=1 Tax=Sesamum latifolium TaxID=2727402 RepID=A0AAW2YD98_9LAMI
MEKFSRSKSSREGPGGSSVEPRTMHELRSYSTSGYNPPQNRDDAFKEVKIKKSGSSSSSKRNWSLTADPELQRKKRVAGYKAYAVEGRMKGSFRKSFRWIKDTCNHLVHGFCAACKDDVEDVLKFGNLEKELYYGILMIFGLL